MFEKDVSDLKKLYLTIRPDIQKRLEDFVDIWQKKDQERMLKELYFCLLTPQSKATRCWECVLDLCNDGLIYSGPAEEVLERISDVRFKNNKTGYLLLARDRFVDNGTIRIVERLTEHDNDLSRREWLVENVKGYGYKEASHFLRNIGLGKELAILDRHILKNMVRYGYIDQVPASIGRKAYLGMEEKMRRFAVDLNVPMSHLDLLLWYMEAGHIFK